MSVFILLVLIYLDPVVVSNLLQLVHSLFVLLKVLGLLLLYFLSLIYLILQLIYLILEESESLGRVIYLCCVLLGHPTRTHGYITALTYETIHALLSFYLLMM